MLAAALSLGGCFTSSGLRSLEPEAVRTVHGDPEAIAACMIVSAGKKWSGWVRSYLQLGELHYPGVLVEVEARAGGPLAPGDPMSSWTMIRQPDGSLLVEFRRHRGLFTPDLTAAERDEVFDIVEACADPARTGP